MGAERQDEPLAGRWREALVGLDEAAGRLCHVLDVEHVVQVAVFVGDQVEHHVVVVLVGVDVVEDVESRRSELVAAHVTCRVFGGQVEPCLQTHVCTVYEHTCKATCNMHFSSYNRGDKQKQRPD